MRRFRLSRPGGGGEPRSLREEAEAEATAELRRVLEGAGLPPADATEVLERTAARRRDAPGMAPSADSTPAAAAPGGTGVASPGGAAGQDDAPETAASRERDATAGGAAAEAQPPPTRRVRKSPPPNVGRSIGDRAPRR